MGVVWPNLENRIGFFILLRTLIVVDAPSRTVVDDLVGLEAERFRLFARVLDGGRFPIALLVHGAAGSGVSAFGRFAHNAIDAVAGATVLVQADVVSAGELELVVREGLQMGRSCVVTSHRPWELSDELLGLLTHGVLVSPPDRTARRFRVWQLLFRTFGDSSPLVDEAMIDSVVDATEGFLTADIEAVVEHLGSGADIPMQSRAQEWLEHARVLLGRGSSVEVFDDLRSYLERFRLV
jgi:hypothetical protein